MIAAAVAVILNAAAAALWLSQRRSGPAADKARTIAVLPGPTAFCEQDAMALQFLREAIRHGYCSYPQMDSEPLFGRIRSLPEFAALREEGRACHARFLSERDK